MKLRLVASALAVLCVAGPVAAQQMTMSRAEGEFMDMGNGQLAILRKDSVRVVVDGVVSEAGATRPDLRRGDYISSIQGQKGLSLDKLLATYHALSTGTEVVLGVVRDGNVEHTVRFPKPATVANAPRITAVTGAGPTGTGAWASSSAGNMAAELVIAGAHIRENGDGLPAVTHRSTHAAAATVPLRAADVITGIDGRSVAAFAGLQMFYDRIASGAPVRLTVRRGAETLDVTFPKPADR